MYKDLNWDRKSEGSASVNYQYRVEVEQGDITDEKVEAIINPANERLAHSGGCAGNILQAAGGDVQIESGNYIRVHGNIPVGECTYTSSGNLKA